MYWKLYTPILLSVLIVLVQSASYIEVDENGDEYEVKRFHIQGRQLNETNPTCVVTRRKRATVPQYGVDPADETYEAQKEDNNEEELDDNEEDDESLDSVHPTEQSLLSDELTTPKTQVNANNKKKVVTEKAESTTAKPIAAEAVKDKEENSNKAETEKPIKNTLQKVTLILPQKPQPEEQEQYEEAQEDQEQVVVVPQNSIQFLQSSYFGNTNGQHYVLAGSQQPQTSAVSQFFNILPTEADYEVPFSFTYEVNPASTSAVWSTGDDVQRPRQDQSEAVDYTDAQPASPAVESPEIEEVVETSNPDEEIVSPEAIVEEEIIETEDGAEVIEEVIPPPAAVAPVVTQTRPTKKVKIVKKRPKKKKKKNKKKKKRRRHRRPIKKNKRKRRPVMHRRQPSSTTTKRPAYNRRRPGMQPKKRTTAKPAQFIRGHQRQKPKRIKKKPGAFTSTVSSTFSSDGNDGNIECIIINKPSTTSSSTSTTTSTTTRRPFWNILGRNADVGEPREYGKRKRVALRFAS